MTSRKSSPHTPDDWVGKKKKTTPKKTTSKKSSPQKKKTYPSQKSKGDQVHSDSRARTPEEESMIKECLALTIFEESEEARTERMAREEADDIDSLNEELAAKFRIQRDTIGRPTKMDLSTTTKLLSAFSIWANEEEACTYAGIHPRTLLRYKDKNPEFCHFVDVMKKQTPLKARMLLNKAFDDVENARLAYTYLRDTYPREFSKGMSVFEGGDGDTEGGAKVVNLIFAPNLWAPSFYDPSKV